MTLSEILEIMLYANLLILYMLSISLGSNGTEWKSFTALVQFPTRNWKASSESNAKVIQMLFKWDSNNRDTAIYQAQSTVA